MVGLLQKMGRPLDQHVRQCVVHPRQEMALMPQQGLLKRHQPEKEISTVQDMRPIHTGSQLLRPKTTRERKPLTIRPNEGRRYSMQTADHQPMGIKGTQTVHIERTHEKGPLSLGQDFLALLNIEIGPLTKDFLSISRERNHSLPEIGPFNIGMMFEIAVATIIRAICAAQMQEQSRLIIGGLHFSIQNGKLAEKFRGKNANGNRLVKNFIRLHSR